MVSLTALWLPILLSAVLVFLASSVLHMLLPYHRSDYEELPGEERVMEVLREVGVPGGDYHMPHPEDMSDLGSPEYLERAERGPVAFLTVIDDWSPAMTGQFVQWFVYCLVVGVFAAYLAGRALEPGAAYLDAFRFTGTAAFAGYALAQWPESIWYGRKWSTTLKNTLDGLVYALLTAGVFGWLWPG